MKKSYLQKMIVAILTAALLMGVLPVGVLATEAEPSAPDTAYEEPLQYTPQDVPQAGVSDIALEDTVAAEAQIVEDIGGSPSASHDDASVDKSRSLQNRFGLTDSQIEQGALLHGSRLAFTSQLSNLAINEKALNLQPEQVQTLASLISSGYTNAQALRALVAKDILNLDLERIKEAKIEEIEATNQPHGSSLLAQETKGADIQHLSSKLGLPPALVNESAESSLFDRSEIENTMKLALRDTYYPSGNGAVTMAADSDVMYYTPEEILGKPYSYSEQGNFRINVNTGDYSYTETDLSIPGKNGLDLVITRQYHSDRASTKETSAYLDLWDNYAFDVPAFYVFYRWFVVDTSVSEGEVTFVEEIVDCDRYKFENPDTAPLARLHGYFTLAEYEEAIEFMKSMLTGERAVVLDTENGNDHLLVTFVPAITEIGTIFEDDAHNLEQEDSYYIDEFGLGHGWMLGFSHLRWVSRGYGDLYNSGRHLMLTLADGTQYDIDEYIGYSGNWIENYIWDDMEFRRCSSDEYPGATFALYYKDGKTEYFNEDGRNIAIKDRFGNTITINYTVESTKNAVEKVEITDTLGNLIIYEDVALNSSEPHYICSQPYNKLWKLSLNGATIRKYYSYTQAYNLTSTFTYPTRLVAVSNEAEEITQYVSGMVPTRFNSFLQPFYRDKGCEMFISDCDGHNLMVPMTEVIYPDNSTSKVKVSCDNVRSIGDNGYRHYIRCDGVYPATSAEVSFDEPTIEYAFGDFDNLEGKAAYNKHYYSVETHNLSYPIQNVSGGLTDNYLLWKNYSLDYTFNLSGQNTDIVKRSYSSLPRRQTSVLPADQTLNQSQTSWVARTDAYTYDDERSTLPTEIKITYTDQTKKKQIETVEKYTYDTKRNILTYTRPDGQVETYTYNAYSIPSSIAYNQNANTAIKVTNTMTADERSIAVTVTTSNGAVVGKTAYRYDSSGRLVGQDDYRSADPNDFVTTTYSYSNSALPSLVSVSGVKAASGSFATGSYGFPAGTVARKQTYNDRGWITSETDANGNTTSYTYDAVGRLTKATHPDGTSISYSYDVEHNTATYTDETGSSWLCTYGKSGKLQTVKDVTTGQLLQTNTYDQLDHLVKKVIYGVSTPDQTTYYSYDTDGRLIEQESVDESGKTIYQELYEYEDGAGKVTKTVTGDDNAPEVRTVSYQDNMGNIVATGVFRNGVEELDTYQYDYLGNQTQVMTAYTKAQAGSHGPTATNTYDYAGRLLTTADAKGNTAAKTYDWLGNQLTEVTPKNNTDNGKTKYAVTYTYDALGRLTRVQTPLAPDLTGQTDYIYDPNGNVVQEQTMTGAKGSAQTTRSTYYTYDSMNRVTQVKGSDKLDGQSGAQDQYAQYTYDALGNIASMAVGGSGNKQTTRYTYDRYSRLLTQTDPLGKAQSYTYDLNGLLTSKTDRRGVTTTNSYDAMGRLTQSMAGTDWLAFTYTMTGQRRTATSNGQTTTYTYNDIGSLTKEELPYATKTMTYGVGGLRTGLKVTAGSKTYLNNQYTYDTLGHLTKVNGVGASAHYSYDSNGNLASVTNGNKTTANYSYNKADLPTDVKNKVDKEIRSAFTYTYGRDGNQLTKADRLGWKTTYTYDGLNRLTQESQAGPGAFTNTYTYDAYGNRQSAVLDGATTTYTYDANNRLISTTGSMEASYTYDDQGNQTQSSVTVNGETVTFDFTYDGFNRLKKVSDSDKETVYTYDADGLRSSKADATGTEYYIYDNGQLVATIPTPAAELYSGTIPASGSDNVPFGLVNGKLYFVEVNGVLYSAKAVMIQEEINPLATPIGGGETPEVPPTDPDDPVDPPVHFGTFVTLEVGGVAIATADGSDMSDLEGPVGTAVTVYEGDPNATSVVYVRGLSLIASVENGQPTYYHYNAHGDVVQLTDSTGTVVKDYTYDAFGVEQNAAEGDNNPFRYCGEQFDTETGNYYLRARYYTPGVGRFTQEDPIGDGVNWYAYCAGNPVAFVDPMGQKKLEVSFAAPYYSELGDAAASTLSLAKSIQMRLNYDYNKRFSVSGIINGQKLSPVNDYKYGGMNLGHSGCEVIANYNALIILGNPHDLNVVANWGEGHGQILDGVFGTLPDSSKQLFEHLGYSVTEETDSSKFDAQAAAADVSIFTFLNEAGDITQGIHTIAIEPTSNGFVAYNFFGGHTNTESFASFADLINKWNLGPMILYGINNK